MQQNSHTTRKKKRLCEGKNIPQSPKASHQETTDERVFKVDKTFSRKLYKINNELNDGAMINTILYIYCILYCFKSEFSDAILSAVEKCWVKTKVR